MVKKGAHLSGDELGGPGPALDFPLTVGYPRPVELVRLLDPVDPDEPPGGGVGLLQVGEAEVFVADDGVARVVVARRRIVTHLKLAETVVRQLVHQAV